MKVFMEAEVVGDLEDILDAVCLLDGVTPAQVAAQALVDALKAFMANDVDVQALVEARRKKRRKLQVVPA